jgi:hypothetical protein
MKMAPTRELYTHAAGRSDVVAGHNVVYTPKFAKINVTASGTATIVAGIAGTKMRVLSGWLISSAGTTLDFRSSTASGANTLTGILTLATTGGSGFVLPFSQVGHFETVTGSSLVLYNSAAVNIGGSVAYIEAT